MKKLLFLALLAAAAWQFFSSPGMVRHGPGILVTTSPQQTPVNDPRPFRHGDYEITPLANFELEARVLSREKYRFDRGADLSPIDLALGWGLMSDESVLEQLSIEQRNRWYYWRSESLPASVTEISRHSANMHMVPASAGISDTLHDLRIGDIVELRGYLIDARADEGYRWSSSLTREDTGSNSCELVWVEQARILSP